MEEAKRGRKKGKEARKMTSRREEGLTDNSHSVKEKQENKMIVAKAILQLCSKTETIILFTKISWKDQNALKVQVQS